MKLFVMQPIIRLHDLRLNKERFRVNEHVNLKVAVVIFVRFINCKYKVAHDNVK